MAARIIYSTGAGSLCPNCRRPVRACVCPKGAPGAVNLKAVRVGREIKGRAGKGVTTVSGLPMTLSDIESLAA
jgi:translation initiation factor 1